MSTLKVLTILGKAGANPDFTQGVRVRGIELLDANSEISVPLAGAAAEVLAGEPHRVKGADGIWRNALLQGNVVVPMVNTDVTLTLAEFNNNSFDVTGVLTANVALILPLNSAQTFVVDNKTTGLFTLTVKNAGGDLGVTVAQGISQLLYSNGTVVEGIQAQAAAHTHIAADITDFAVEADLRVARGQAGGTASLDGNQEVLELPAGAAAAVTAGNPTHVLQANGAYAAPAAGGGGSLGDFIMELRAAFGSYGGTTLNTTRNPIPYNTTIKNTIAGAVWDAALFRVSLPAGTYKLVALEQQVFAANGSILLLHNVTTGLDIHRGSSVYTNSGQHQTMPQHEFTLAATSVLEFQAFTVVGQTTTGFGNRVILTGATYDKFGYVSLTRLS